MYKAEGVLVVIISTGGTRYSNNHIGTSSMSAPGLDSDTRYNKGLVWWYNPVQAGYIHRVAPVLHLRGVGLMTYSFRTQTVITIQTFHYYRWIGNAFLGTIMEWFRVVSWHKVRETSLPYCLPKIGWGEKKDSSQAFERNWTQQTNLNFEPGTLMTLFESISVALLTGHAL